MSRRVILVLVALGVLLCGGTATYHHMFASTTSYADHTSPTVEPGATDDQLIFLLQSDLGNAAAEMAQLQNMARRLQFGKMKAMGRHLQDVAAGLEPRLSGIEDSQARRLLADGIAGLRMVGEGAEQLDRDKSMQGVNQVLESLEKLTDR